MEAGDLLQLYATLKFIPWVGLGYADVLGILHVSAYLWADYEQGILL